MVRNAWFEHEVTGPIVSPVRKQTVDRKWDWAPKS